MFNTKQKRQLEIRSWPQFTVPYEKHDGSKITMREIRAWCKRNLAGDYKIDAIYREGVLVQNRIAIGAMIRIKEVEDQVLFRLRWHDFK